jgi:hypothetical protein
MILVYICRKESINENNQLQDHLNKVLEERLNIDKRKLILKNKEG